MLNERGQMMTHQVLSNHNTTGSTDRLDERIAELVTEVRTSQSHIESLQELIDEAKEELRELLLYDTRALDQLIIKDPLHYGWLKDHRSESVIRSNVQVK
jgi:hypothetical protein